MQIFSSRARNFTSSIGKLCIFLLSFIAFFYYLLLHVCIYIFFKRKKNIHLQYKIKIFLKNVFYNQNFFFWGESIIKFMNTC